MTLYICFSRAEGPLGVSKPTNNQAVLWHGLHGLEAPCGLSLNQYQTPAATSCIQPPPDFISSRPLVMGRIPTVVCDKHPISSVYSSSHVLENVLLPPSLFMTMKSQTKVCKMSCPVCMWMDINCIYNDIHIFACIYMYLMGCRPATPVPEMTLLFPLTRLVTPR